MIGQSDGPELQSLRDDFLRDNGSSNRMDTWVAFGGFGIDVGQPNLKITILKYFVNINYCSLGVILI